MPAAGYVKTARPLLDGTASKVVAGITPASIHWSIPCILAATLCLMNYMELGPLACCSHQFDPHPRAHKKTPTNCQGCLLHSHAMRKRMSLMTDSSDFVKKLLKTFLMLLFDSLSCILPIKLTDPEQIARLILNLKKRPAGF